MPNEGHIIALIDSRASSFPHVRVLGEFLPPKRDLAQSDAEWGWFYLAQGSSALAEHIGDIRDLQQVAECKAAEQAYQSRLRFPTVALLYPASIDFIYHWLAFMRLGYAILLLAPQLAASQIAHLCDATATRFLFFEKSCALHLNEVRKGLYPRTYLQLNEDQGIIPAPVWVTPECTAYIHHTSGTTSGQPKQIPQPHAAATLDMVGVGGAPLDKAIGNSMVESGVNLRVQIGIFYAWARNLEMRVKFEKRDECGNGENYKLIIKSRWPCVAKHNRPDGSYATSDIFLWKRDGKWQYRYRNDALLVLGTGKQFDPDPIESRIATHLDISSIARGVCVYVGTGLGLSPP
ncbi:hypothetical protein BDZ91DRAFT_759228 [Kalaharituber pfeilii]|nr:hypothetical protein BDZ91DRAFT_759228 [Kalaharituber pfeilii]